MQPEKKKINYIKKFQNLTCQILKQVKKNVKFLDVKFIFRKYNALYSREVRF